MDLLYDTDKLYLGIVEFSERDKTVNRIHVLTETPHIDEMCDLNLCRLIKYEGEKEGVFTKTLVPFRELLMTSDINFKALSREDALKMGEYYNNIYLRILNTKRVRLTLKTKQ